MAREKAEKSCRRSSGHLGWDLLAMKPQGVCEVGEAPDAQAQEKGPGAADQPGAESGGAETLGVPYRCPPRGKVSWGRTVQGKDVLSGLERGEPALRGIPLSSARTLRPTWKANSGCPGSPPWASGSSSPKPASRTCLCLTRAPREMPSFPQGCPQWRDGPCSRGKHHPSLEIVTRGAASAALDAAGCSQRRA